MSALAQTQRVVTLTPDEYERLKPFLYHVVPPDTAQGMAALRTQYIHLALTVVRGQERSRSQSIALTALEDSLMRAIQGLAMTGEPQLPPAFAMEDVPAQEQA